MTRGLGRFVRRNTIALLALFLALGGTSYAAATLINGSQIKPHTIAKNRLTNKAIAQLKGNRGPRGLQGARGPTGAQGVQGVQGVQGIQGIPGTARAYALVSGTTVTRAKNVTGVANPGAGIFCITLAAGIDVTQTGLVASPYFPSDGTFFIPNGSQAIVEWDGSSTGGTCAAGTLVVLTGVRSVSTAGSGDGDVRTVTNTLTNQPFFFVVP